MQCEQIPPAPNDIYKSFKLLHWKISVLKYQMWEQFTEKTLGKDKLILQNHYFLITTECKITGTVEMYSVSA